MPIDREIAREKMILAAERLVAEEGLEALSLRRVNIAAGQKNTSAALYHFGSKEGLLLAIFDYRLASTDARRHELLDKDASSVRAVIEAWLLPDVEEISYSKGGSYHARFLAIVTNHPDFPVDQLWQRPGGSSFDRVAQSLRSHLPDLPDSIFSMRFGLAMMQSIVALADQERLQSRKSAISPALFISHLIDVMTALFQAPLSETTEQELQIAVQNSTRKQA